MKTMRIAAVFFLIFIPFATTFIFYRQKNIKHPHLLYPYRHTSQEALQAILSIMPETVTGQDQIKDNFLDKTTNPNKYQYRYGK